MPFKQLDENDIKVYTDEKWSHFIGSMLPQRPGVGLFSTVLEHKFFPPGTEKNDEFLLLTIKWVNESVWFVSSIPTKYIAYAEATAKFVGVALKKDQFPMMSNGPVTILTSVKRESWEQEFKNVPEMNIFPLYHGTNIYTMENTKDHPIYKSMNAQEILEEERKVIGEIIAEDEKERGIKFDQADWDEIEEWRKYMFEK